MPAFNREKISRLLVHRIGPTEQCSSGIVVVPSPDRSHAVVFSHGWEMSMMNFSYHFTLLDRTLAVVEGFERLRAIHTSCKWSSDSAIFAVAGAPWGGLLLWNLSRKSFAVVRTSGRQFVFDFKGASHLSIRPDPEQLRAMNCDSVFGGGKSESPVERFKAPAKSLLEISKLRWFPRGKLASLEKIAKAAAVLDMDFVRDGFFPFKGKFPASTTATINTRRFEVFQLELFAEYGDQQAQAWLRDVKKKVRPANWAQARWTPVAKYLGARKRTIPPPVLK